MYIGIETAPIFSFILVENPYNIIVYSEGKNCFRGMCMDGRIIVMRIFKIYNEEE